MVSAKTIVVGGLIAGALTVGGPASMAFASPGGYDPGSKGGSNTTTTNIHSFNTKTVNSYNTTTVTKTYDDHSINTFNGNSFTLFSGNKILSGNTVTVNLTVKTWTPPVSVLNGVKIGNTGK